MEQAVSQRQPFWTPRRVIFATLTIVAIAIGFWLMIRYRLVLFSLFEAIVFSTAISPWVRWFERKGVSRGISTGLIFLLIVGFLIGFVLLAAPIILDQASTISQTISSFYQNLRAALTNSPSLLLQRFALRLPPAILSVSPLPANTGQTPSLDAVTLLLGYLGIISSSLFAIIAVLLLTFYWTIDRERTIRSLLVMFPVQQRDKLRGILEATENRVGAYIRGVAILCLAVGALSLVSYLIIGLPHAFLLGLMAAVFEVVPLIGPLLGALPAIVTALSNDPNKILWVIIAYSVIQFSENHFLVPRVMNKTVGVNPVVSLLAFAAFSSLFGFAGALLAIPMAVLIQILADRYLLGPDTLVTNTPPGRDPVSLLRYETDELVRDVRKQVRVKEGDIVEEKDEVEDTIEAIASDLDSILAKADQNEAVKEQPA